METITKSVCLLLLLYKTKKQKCHHMLKKKEVRSLDLDGLLNQCSLQFLTFCKAIKQEKSCCILWCG